jgi:EAL domain-containing protein (putative c-di-GMP-specific phosphodiesterase class I)/GGDEF domain-containing protein
MTDRNARIQVSSATDANRDAEISGVGASLLPRDAAAIRTNGHRGTYRSVLMLVSSPDGTVSAVLPGEGPSAGGLDADAIPSSLTALWPADVCTRISDCVRRCIRSRRLESMDLEIAEPADRLQLIFVPHGRDSALIVVLDVGDSADAYSRALDLAYVDRATTLPTREYFLDQLERLMNVSQLKEQRAAVICFSIEQSEGHGNAFSGHTQDAVLKELAARLVHSLRGVNKLGEPDYERYSVAARIDYRQYAVLLPGIGGGADAESVAVRLIDALQQPVTLGTRQVTVTVRAGLALFPQDGAHADTLLENALVAMEEARSSQTDSYKFHSGTLKLRALQRNELELELKAALDQEQFSLDYLPIVDATTGAVASVEALLRWPQAVFGTQRTQKVVALAERTGLIVRIGEWVVKQGLGDLKRWHEAGHAGLKLAINLSLQQFSRPDLPQRLTAALAEQGVAPGFLDVEITEYMVFRDALAGHAAARALHDAGIGVVVDDFGTGGCSIAHLSRSPARAVKIDNSFVATLESQESDRAACAAMIALAHQLGRTVSAEGVETLGQAQVLREQGCDLLQGFLISRPIPAAGIATFLASRQNGSTP